MNDGPLTIEYFIPNTVFTYYDQLNYWLDKNNDLIVNITPRTHNIDFTNMFNQLLESAIVDLGKDIKIVSKSEKGDAHIAWFLMNKDPNIIIERKSGKLYE